MTPERSASDQLIQPQTDQPDWQAAMNGYFQARMWPACVQTLMRHGAELRAARRCHEVLAWIDRIPVHELTSDLCMLQLHCQTDLGDFDGALFTLDRLITQLDEERAELHRLRSMQSALEPSVDLIADPHRGSVVDLRALGESRSDQITRLHQQGRMLADHGKYEAALASLERASDLARVGGDLGLLPQVWIDHAQIAMRVGRYHLADGLLRLAQRTLHDRPASAAPGLAVVLNMRAQVALHSDQLAEALVVAQQAYVHALASATPELGSVVLSTLGDLAFVQRDWRTALIRYEAAAMRAQRAGQRSRMPYLLAMQAHAARHLSDRAWLATTLSLLEQHQPETTLETAWLHAGRTAAQLALDMPANSFVLERSLHDLGDASALAYGMLALLLADVYWHKGQRDAAARTWFRIDQLMLNGRSSLPRLLLPMASCNQSLLLAARQRWNSQFAQRVLAPLRARPAVSRLVVRVLGTVEVRWDNQSVPLPRHGIALLTLLLLAGSSGISADEARERLWGSSEANPAGWRKLLERMRKYLPTCMHFDGTLYRLLLPFPEIDADLLLVRHTPLIGADEQLLRRAAEYATATLLPGSDMSWVIGERSRVLRRGAALWLSLGNLERDRQHWEEALLAYTTALRLAPLSERIIISLLDLYLHLDRFDEAIAAYLTYRYQLDETFGVDPAPEIDCFYHYAMELIADAPAAWYCSTAPQQEQHACLS